MPAVDDCIDNCKFDFTVFMQQPRHTAVRKRLNEESVPWEDLIKSYLINYFGLYLIYIPLEQNKFKNKKMG